MRNQQPLVVLVAPPLESSALELGRALVDEHLATGVNVVLRLPVAEGAPAYEQWVRESIPIEGG